MIRFDFDKVCCGCFACIDVCPKQCIIQSKNRYGFLVPEVDGSRCIDCGLCERVCPVIEPQKNEFDERKVYSAYNLDGKVRSAGSSGSVFYTLAEAVISKGGVVFGAAFTEHFRLVHTSAETMTELMPLLKSKYIQSNTKGVYKSVKEQLKTGRDVLFVGTPCQCNALYKYLGNNKPDNLLLVDFICHGVPSQDLFDKAIESYERKNNCKIEEFTFRHKKSNSTHNFHLTASNPLSEFYTIEESFEYFPFYYGFKKYCCFRNSCYNCQFCVEERVSDLTLADFWRLEKLDSTITQQEFNKGYSMVIVNSHRGRSLFFSCLTSLNVQERNLKDISKFNYAYTNPTRRGIYAMSFWSDYEKMDYDDLEKKHLVFIPFEQLPFYRKIARYLIWKLDL